MRGFVTVTPKKLSSGNTTFWITGTVRGERIQLQRQSAIEANAVADRINARATASRAVPKLTKLTDEQLRAAEAGQDRLPAGKTCLDAVIFYNQHSRPISIVPIAKARAAYIEVKLTEDKNCQKVVDVLDYDLGRLFKDQRISSTAEMTWHRIKKQVYAKDTSSRTKRDRFDRFRRFCDFLVKSNWLLRNPMAGEKKPPEDDTLPPTIFSVERCQKLLQTAWTDPEGPEMLPYFAMCTLSGVRPTEMMRAGEHQFFLDEGHNIFEVWKGKTAWRNVELIPALVNILVECRNRGLNLCFWSKRKFNRIRRDAGVFDEWDNDILRHSSASYHYAAHRDIHWLEANLGNSEKVLFRHYIRRSVRPQEGERFLQMTVDFTAPRRQPVGA